MSAMFLNVAAFVRSVLGKVVIEALFKAVQSELAYEMKKCRKP